MNTIVKSISMVGATIAGIASAFVALVCMLIVYALVAMFYLILAVVGWWFLKALFNFVVFWANGGPA